MAIIISNAFSLNMLPPIKEGEIIEIKVQILSPEGVIDLLKSESFTSAIGHESTAQLLTDLLGIPVAFDRKPIKLNEGDKLIVAQLLERLPEGKILSKEEIKDLVVSDKLKFFVVTFKTHQQ